MLYYMAKYKLGWLGEIPPPDQWWFGISPEGFGSVAMLLNFMVAILVSIFTPVPPKHIQELVENIRIPNINNNAHEQLPH